MGQLERIVFFGTPAFAVPTLEALVAAGRRPILVVSQPSKPVGRGGAVQDPPVVACARRHGLAVAQPLKVREEAFLERLRELAPDVAVVVAFGQIFPQRLLDIPAAGCINLHGSLLPAWRGAAPIQAALAAGETRTGVTTMKMEAGLDSGPMLLLRELAVGPSETAGELAPRLAELGAGLMVETLAALEAGSLEPRRQDDALATYAPRLAKEDGVADFALPAEVLFNRWRAMMPWPGLTAALAAGSGEPAPLKLVALEPRPERETAEPPGTLLGLDGEGLLVACGMGSVIALTRVQRPGRKVVAARDLVNGERHRAGERFAASVAL